MFRVALAALYSLCLLTPFAHAAEINVSGSTSVARIMDIIAEEYNKSHPDSFVAVQGVGSTAGITLLKKGVADVAMSSRYLTENEEDENLQNFIVAFDGIAVVINQSNPVANLSREQLYDIYKGKISNWKQVGGNDQRIAVVTREASSGSRFSFESLLGLTKVIKDRLVSDINPNNLVVNSNSMVKTLVNHNSQAIGFISTGSVDRSVKAIKFEGVEATPETIANHTYQLSRPFLLLHYPAKDRKEVAEFFTFLQSDRVKQLISEYGYVPTAKYEE